MPARFKLQLRPIRWILVAGAALVAALAFIWERGSHGPSAPIAISKMSSGRAPTADAPVAEADPSRRAAVEALAIPDPGARARAFGRAFQTWNDRDPDAALAFLRQLPRGREYSSALLLLLDNLSRRDLAQALSLARNLVQTPDEARAYSLLFDRLARRSLTKAVEELPLVPAGEARRNAIGALAGVWTQTNVEAAIAWAQQLPDAADRAVALEFALGDFASTHPLAAIEMAQKSLEGPAFERTVGQAVRRLAEMDPEDAARLVTLLRPGDEHTMTASVVARALARRDIDRALAWVGTITVDLTRWTVLNSVLTVWVQRDRDAAARYVLGIPPGYALDFAARHVAGFLAAEPRDALAWAAALPTDSARNAAYPMIASTWAQRAPADAVRWAAGLREDPLNAEALPAAFAYWQLQDPRAARAWLQTAALDPAMKDWLLEP